MIVLSPRQGAELLRARAAGQPSIEASLDLGRSRVSLRIDSQGATAPDGIKLAWELIEEIAASSPACYEVDGDGARRIQRFSEQTDRVYSLYPTDGPPTMLVGGFQMHRTKGIDPAGDTQQKVRPLLGPGSRVFDRVLDVCTGLGYTAIALAEHAREVTTIELDPEAHEIARRNPWSEPLFSLPNIRRLLGDACDLITTFEAGAFERIVHDPPTLSLGGDLYALAFYRELHRVLGDRGRLFHYIGDPRSMSGARVTKGVVRRLHEAGFRRVEGRPAGYGVLASK